MKCGMCLISFTRSLLCYSMMMMCVIIDDILLYSINCIIACAFALFMNVLVDIVTGNSYLAPDTAKFPVLNSDFFDIGQTVAIFTSRIMSPPPPPCTVHRRHYGYYLLGFLLSKIIMLSLFIFNLLTYCENYVDKPYNDFFCWIYPLHCYISLAEAGLFN